MVKHVLQIGNDYEVHEKIPMLGRNLINYRQN